MWKHADGLSALDREPIHGILEEIEAAELEDELTALNGCNRKFDKAGRSRYENREAME
jgi:hypothetical protein